MKSTHHHLAERERRLELIERRRNRDHGCEMVWSISRAASQIAGKRHSRHATQRPRVWGGTVQAGSRGRTDINVKGLCTASYSSPFEGNGGPSMQIPRGIPILMLESAQ